MAQALRTALAAFARLILSLRYRVRIHGLDALPTAPRGTLILPNHPGYSDPPLVLAFLWPRFRPRPMLLRSMFDHPLLAWIPGVLRALPIPDLAQASTEARQQTEASLEAVVDGLQRGENILLWPSGKVQKDGVERLGSARSVASILERMPDVRIMLVRTRGLRGSSFSYARTGSAPALVPKLLQGFGLILANLLAFMPRRRVELTLEAVDPQALPGAAREQVNPFLEEWYEADGGEEPTHVPYHFLFGAREFDFPAPPRSTDRDFAGIDAKTREAIASLLHERHPELESEAFDDGHQSLESHGFDSLERMELSLEVEDRFGFRGAGVPSTVGDLWDLAAGSAGEEVDYTAPPIWQAGGERPGKLVIEGDTILEALVRRGIAQSREAIAADDLSGALTYERFLVAIRLFAKRLRAQVPADHVGILLPASVACDLLIFAVHLAGKTPVMLNWTTGPGNLAHAAEVMRLSHVVSSKRFVDRMAIEVRGTEYLFLEDVKAGVGKLEALTTLLATRFLSGRLLRSLPSAEPEDPAVILFTSGSEKAPKAVPLTHHNILANLRGMLDGYDVYRRDVFLGFLPPFHSFGFTVTVMLPLLGGCRVVHHPDPTDAGALARKLAAYGATLVGGTPTFLGYILDRCRPEDLETVRWALVGGEQSPNCLFEQFARLAPHAELLEGYGVTECSPLVSCTQPDSDDRGTIGRALPGVELRIVDPETFEPLDEPDTDGMLLVAGPNVFPGYLAYDGPSPFRELDGKRYYVTGDLASLGADGRCRFKGRLKRFLKAGGEMISLPAIEAPIAHRYPAGDCGPRVAVEGVDHPERRIVLFTTESIALRDANALLQEAGLRGVLRLDAVERVESIPVLGTGKIDYKVLRARLAE